jgi:alpha-mannosidase
VTHPSQRGAPLTFHLVFHTHWDREWYLPRAALTARLVPVVDQLIDALEQDSAFRTFLLDGQTVLLEDYLRIRPDQEARVRALVGAGRLGTGPWYVLADELIPSGEALIRNLLIGTAASRRLGRRLDVLYSPDAFGHPAALPALAAQFDIRFGVVWRGLAPRRDDGDLFRWAAPDGSDILLYQLPRDGYEIGASLPADFDALRETWPGVREVLVSRASSRQVAVFIGADHHAHHPRPSMLRDLLAEIEAGNEVRISSAEEFLRAADGERPQLRSLRAELRDSYGYTWTLQGVHGTRLPLKRLNSRVQLLLERWAEPLAALAYRHRRRDRRPLLVEAWRSVVRSHFHDAIAGCAHDRVADAARGRLVDAAATARELVRASIDDLTGHDPDAAKTASGASALVTWNPAARRRGGIAVADVSFFRRDVLVGPPGARLARAGKGFDPFLLASADGRTIPVQVIEERRALERRDAWRHYPDMDEVDAVRVAFVVEPMPGLALAKLTPVSASRARVPTGRARADGRRLSNGVIEVDVAPDGTLSLRDLRTGARLARLLSLESDRDEGDTYSFAPGGGGIRRSRARVTVRTQAAGPLVGIVEATWEALEASFRLHVELRSGEPFARLSIEIVNRGRDRRLRARFPLGLRNVPVIAGAAFGWERRAAGVPASESPAESPVPTAPAQRFVSAVGSSGGLALLVPGHCEYEWQPGGDLLLTLLRSVGQLSRGDLSTRPGHAGWPTPTPDAQCPGADRITLALAPLPAEPAPEQLEALWEDAFLPLSTRWIRDAGPLRMPPDSVELGGDGLILSAVKPAEDGRGIVLRCWNAQDRPVDGAWTIVPAPKRAWRIRADEAAGEPIEVGRAGAIRFSAGARALATIRIE